MAFAVHSYTHFIIWGEVRNLLRIHDALSETIQMEGGYPVSNRAKVLTARPV